MKYYIASGLDNAEQVKKLKAILDERGWEHTYDWTVHGSVAGHGADVFSDTADKEIEGVYMADVVIVLLPGGRGTHTELGAALGVADCYVRHIGETAEPRIVIYSPDPERDFGTTKTTCAFYHHPLVERFSSWDEMVSTFLTECGA